MDTSKGEFSIVIIAITALRSAKLNVGSSSWGVADFHTSISFILSPVVWLIIAEVD